MWVGMGMSATTGEDCERRKLGKTRKGGREMEQGERDKDRRIAGKRS